MKEIDILAGRINKDEVIDHLLNLMEISDQEIYKQGIVETATKMGEETLVFYVPVDKEPRLSVVVVKDNVLESLPEKLFFMIAVPKNDVDILTKILTLLSKMVKERKFEEQLINAQDPEKIITLIKEFESYDLLIVNTDAVNIKAVENLKIKAEEMNISFKIESNDIQLMLQSISKHLIPLTPVRSYQFPCLIADTFVLK